MGIIYENKFNYEGMVDKIPTYTLQEKEVEITENGQLIINPDEGYDCLTSVTANINVPSSGEGGGGYDIETIVNDDGTQEVHIVDAPNSGTYVKFIDFDGAVLHTFSKAEALALETLPDPPDHSDNEVPLTFDGWNWSLEDIKDYYDACPEANIIIGALYHPTDGKTHIIFSTEAKDVICGVGSYYTSSVDWGDGSSPSNGIHTYAEKGEYHAVIELKSSMILGSSESSSNSSSASVSNTIKRAYVGPNVELREYVFNYATRMETVTLPSTLKKINSGAFTNCHSLKALIIPSAPMNLTRNTFSGSMEYLSLPCRVDSNLYSLSSRNLKDLTIPLGTDLTVMDMFSNTYSLKKIAIPNGVTKITTRCFQYSGVEEVYIGDTVETLDSYCFSNCTELRSVYGGKNITSIGTYSFEKCNKLVTLPKFTKLTSIDQYAISGCYALTSLVAKGPNLVFSSSAFSSNSSLREIDYGNPEVISNNMCYWCTTLDIKIPEGVKTISANAFSNNHVCQEVVIPSTVTSINGKAFDSCYCLNRMVMKPTTPPTLDGSLSRSNSRPWKIVVPKGSLSAYLNATNWSALSSIMVEEE